MPPILATVVAHGDAIFPRPKSWPPDVEIGRPASTSW
jgi:hypothetical protein